MQYEIQTKFLLTLQEHPNSLEYELYVGNTPGETGGLIEYKQ